MTKFALLVPVFSILGLVSVSTTVACGSCRDAEPIAKDVRVEGSTCVRANATASACGTQLEVSVTNSCSSRLVFLRALSADAGPPSDASGDAGDLDVLDNPYYWSLGAGGERGFSGSGADSRVRIVDGRRTILAELDGKPVTISWLPR